MTKLASLLWTAFALVGCGSLLGLDDYEVGPLSAGGSNTGGGAGEGGAGATDACNCEDRNECTTHECDDGECITKPAAVGTRCARGVCDGEGACVACVDSAAGSERDSGCPAGSPVCDESSDPPRCTGCDEDADCDDGVECTSDSCEQGVCSNEVFPAGSPCSQGVCDGQGHPQSCVACLDDEQRGMDSGCSDAEPVCDARSSPAKCAECVGDADCDDGNDCTLDVCEDGACSGTTIRAGEECSEGYCNGVAGEETCGECIDDAPDGAVDLGCAEGAPTCDVTLIPARCTGCMTNADCDDGIECTTDTCNGSGACVRTPDDEVCPDSGDACQPNKCVAGSGCQLVDISESKELIVNGAFDAAGGWQEAATNNYAIVHAETDTPTLAHTFPRLAWMAGMANDLAEMWSAPPITVPEGTRSLEFSIYYHVESTIDEPDRDITRIALRTAEDDTEVYSIAEWANQDVTSGWTLFSTSVDVSELEADELELYIYSQTGDWGEEEFTDVFLDTASMVANICAEE